MQFERDQDSIKENIKQFIRSKENLCLTPEIYDQIKGNSGQKLSLQPKLISSFVFGFSFLELLCNKGLNQIFVRNSFDWNLLEVEIQKITERFSNNDILQQSLQCFLNKDPSMRQTCKEFLISVPNYEHIKLSIKEQLSRANYSTYQHSYIVRNKNTPVATPVYEYQTFSQANQSY